MKSFLNRSGILPSVVSDFKHVKEKLPGLVLDTAEEEDVGMGMSQISPGDKK